MSLRVGRPNKLTPDKLALAAGLSAIFAQIRKFVCGKTICKTNSARLKPQQDRITNLNSCSISVCRRINFLLTVGLLFAWKPALLGKLAYKIVLEKKRSNRTGNFNCGSRFLNTHLAKWNFLLCWIAKTQITLSFDLQ